MEGAEADLRTSLMKTRRFQWCRQWVMTSIVLVVCGAAVSLRAAQESPLSSGDSAPHAKTEQERARDRAQIHALLEAVEATRRVVKQDVADQRHETRDRVQAEKIAIQVAREKAKQQALQARAAQHQLQVARERQLKSLYQQGLSLYREGAYQQAIDTLQQLALVDPAHPLVKTAERLIAKIELKQFEQHARAQTALSPEAHGAAVPDLERLLTQKRMELETVFNYARSAAHDRDYDMASKLLTGLLVQDPSHRQAQQLLEQVQRAKLKEQSERAERQMEQDEQRMINEVVKAQLLPKPPSSQPPTPVATDTAEKAFSAKLQQPITLDFHDVSLRDVLDFIADAANVSIIPSPQLDLKNRLVSIKAQQLPLESAMKYLTKSLSLAYRVDQDAIVIASPEEFLNQPMDTRVYFLRTGLGPFALQAAAVDPNPKLVMESMKNVIEKTIPQPSNSKLVVDERSGALIVTNTAENHALVERLLSQLDVTPLQVLIEARFVELTLTELEQLGIESVLNGDVDLTKQEAANHTLGPGHQISKGGGFKFPSLSRKSEALNLTLQGVLTGVQFETVLHLLEETKKSKTLSAPRVTTLNNQSATIRVVDEFRYPTRYEVSLVQFDINGDGDFNDAGETEFVNVPQDFKERDVGILLNVTPSVGKDLHTMTLVLMPEVSQFSQFRDLGGGVTVPEFTSSQLTTSVVIEDGQTVVLGGLMKDATSKTVTKVPVLGDLPVIGGLFRQKEESSTRKNLLIFITARILAPRGQTT